jgi:hypothetical protein
MTYVMVPVPEHMVMDVMQQILRWSRRDSLGEWTEELMTEVFEAIDEPSRALLSISATAQAAGAPITEPNAADAMQMTQREVVSIAKELNETAEQRDLPLFFTFRAETQLLSNGRTQEVRVFPMAPKIAELVLLVDRKHLMAEGSTLPGDAS